MRTILLAIELHVLGRWQGHPKQDVSTREVMGAKMTHKDRHKMKDDQLPQPNLLRVFVVCLLAVGALFFAYEIVERTLLKGVSTGVIHALHILRGVSAATIASVLATLVLLRQTQDRASDVILTPSKKSWKHRLQNVRLRTKIVIPMVALAVLPSIGVGIFTISRMQKSLREGAIQRVDFDTGGFSLVAFEQPTEPFPAHHRPVAARRLGWLYRPTVAQSLVRPF